jgi:hypothetical protein
MQKFLLLLVLGVLIPNLLADDSKRELKIDEKPDRIVVNSKEKDGDSKSEIQFEIKTDNGELEIRVNYLEDSDTSKSRFQARLGVFEVIEFLNTDGVKGYQLGDQIIQSIDLDQDGKGLWDDIVCTTGNNRYDCDVNTSDGKLGASIHLVGDVTDVQGVPTRPTSLKFDININLTDKRNDSYVALIIRSFSKEKQSVKDKSDENDEGFTKTEEKQVSFGDNGFFSWATDATVAGTPGIEVFNGPLTSDDTGAESGENGHRLAFTFISTTRGLIEWDPKLGTTASTSDASAAAPALTFFMVSTVVIALSNFF